MGAPTTTTLVSSLNPSTYTDSIDFTATVSEVLATGTVTFSVDGTAVATRTVSGGVAVYTTTGLAVGTYNVVADYNGDGTYNASTSNTVVQVVNKANTTTAVSVLGGRAPCLSPTTPTLIPGENREFLIGVSGGGTPTGNVQLALDGVDFGPVQILSSGFADLASWPVPSHAIGNTTLEASYAGDANHNTSSGSSPVTIGVPTYVTFGFTGTPESSGLTQIYTAQEGITVRVTAQLRSNFWILSIFNTLHGLPVTGHAGSLTFKEGSTVLGVAAIDTSTGNAFLDLNLPVGVHIIDAFYAGDAPAFLWAGDSQHTEDGNFAPTPTYYSATVTITPASGGETTPPTPPTPPPNPNEPVPPPPPPITKIPCPVVITCPDPLLSNYSMEQSDGPSFHSVAFPIFDPYDPSWRATNCIGQECESTVSQEDADLCARRLSDECQGATFFSSSASCSTLCFDGLAFVYTVPAGLFVSTSQDLANRIAFEYACLKARQHIICLSDLTGECTTTSTISFTVTASGFFLDHTGNANFWALTFGALPTGMTVTTGFLNDTVLISGTPSTPGVYTFTIQVTAPNGDYMGKEYVVEVLPTAPPNVSINQALAAPTGAGTGRALTGTLPPGTRLAQDINGNDILLGTPTTNGTCAFTIVYT